MGKKGPVISGSLEDIAQKLWKHYEASPKRLKIIDVYLCFLVLIGALVFVYAMLMGSFPFNAFLSSFLCAVGSFVFTVGLRLQVDPNTKEECKVSTNASERAFADYVFCNLVLFLAVLNFMG
ncbi:unnamed protein product [Chrysoparadoxa australica]